jgi:hypothetical protein
MFSWGDEVLDAHLGVTHGVLPSKCREELLATPGCHTIR